MPRNQNKKIITIATLVAIALFVYLLIPNLTVIVFAGLTAYFATPLYKRIKSHIHKKWWSLALTRIGIILFLIIPVITFGSFLISELGQMYSDLTTSDTLDRASTWISNHLDQQSITRIETQFDTNIEKIKATALNTIKNIATTGTKITASIGSSFVWFITSIILYIFIVSALLTKKKSIADEIKDIIPVDDHIVETYIERLTLMSSSMVTSTFVIALVQWVVTGLSFWIAGVPYPLFFTCLASLLGIIPMVGSAFVAVPVSVVLMLSGSIWSGIFVLLFNQIIVNNIDNILRPRLVDKKAQINDTLLILSLFGGMTYRGMMGILYGPLLMSFILTTIEIAKDKKILH